MLAIIFNLISSMLIIPIFFSIIDSSYIANTTFNKIFDIAGINLIKNFDHAIIFALFIIILSNLIILLSNVLKNYYQWHLITSFKKRYFDLVANLNYEKFVNLSRSEFVKDMTAEIDRLVTGYYIPIQTLITKIMFLFLCFIFLFLKNPTIASITVICITLVYFFIFLLVKKKNKRKRFIL